MKQCTSPPRITLTLTDNFFRPYGGVRDKGCHCLSAHDIVLGIQTTTRMDQFNIEQITSMLERNTVNLVSLDLNMDFQDHQQDDEDTFERFRDALIKNTQLQSIKFQFVKAVLLLTISFLRFARIRVSRRLILMRICGFRTTKPVFCCHSGHASATW